jgi:Mrp family chromosome partitioning ATPase
MEHVIQAIERARELQGAGAAQPAKAQAVLTSPESQQQPLVASKPAELPAAQTGTKQVVLNSVHLEANRLIGHDYDDRRSRSYDILRTQVMQSMDASGHQLLAVTSPTPGCGKTVTAINLALSIARHPERSVLLVDLDLQKPQVSTYLGLKANQGIVSVLRGNLPLADATLEARVGAYRFMVLPCEGSVVHSSEWTASAMMASVLRELKRSDPNRIVIVDLPPMLVGDDVISILPLMDCALFVLAVGASKTAEIKECSKHLQSTPVVRTVVNKVSTLAPIHYY